MQYLFIFIFISLISGCIRYSEEWHFNKNGSGTVRIICEPSDRWLEHAGASNWVQSAILFIPPYKSLSQEFARVGVKINHCKFTTKKGKPRVDMLISFNSLTSIARTSLFSDRLLQWRRKPFKVTLLHRLSTKRRLGKAELASLDDGILSDATFDVKMFFPGRVINVQGAKKNDNCVYVNADLSKLATGDSITIIATARTGYPFWFKLILSISIIIFITLIILFLWKKFIKKSEISNADTFTYTQPL
jgi:hypothetical protein